MGANASNGDNFNNFYIYKHKNCICNKTSLHSPSPLVDEIADFTY